MDIKDIKPGMLVFAEDKTVLVTATYKKAEFAYIFKGVVVESTNEHQPVGYYSKLWSVNAFFPSSKTLKVE